MISCLSASTPKPIGWLEVTVLLGTGRRTRILDSSSIEWVSSLGIVITGVAEEMDLFRQTANANKQTNRTDQKPPDINPPKQKMTSTAYIPISLLHKYLRLHSPPHTFTLSSTPLAATQTPPNSPSPTPLRARPQPTPQFS